MEQIFKLQKACDVHGNVWAEASSGPHLSDPRWNSRPNNVTYNDETPSYGAISYPFTDGMFCNDIMVPKYFKHMRVFSPHWSRVRGVSGRNGRAGNGNSYAYLASCLNNYETCVPFYYWSGTNTVVEMNYMFDQSRTGYTVQANGNGAIFAGVDNDPWTVTRINPHFTGSITPHFQELRRLMGKIPATVFGEPASRQNLAYLKDGHKAYYIFEVVEASSHEETRNASQLLYPCDITNNRISCGMKIMGPDEECERIQLVGGERRLKCTTKVVNGLLLPIRILFKQIAQIAANFRFCWQIQSEQSTSAYYQSCYNRGTAPITCSRGKNGVQDWSRVAGDRFHLNSYHRGCNKAALLRASASPNCNRFDEANFTIPSFDLRGKLYFNSPEIVTV